MTSNSTFANANGATLAIGATGSYTLQGLLTNSGAITVANGGQLIATVGGITNSAGGTITVAAGGSVTDDLNNAGTSTTAAPMSPMSRPTPAASPTMAPGPATSLPIPEPSPTTDLDRHGQQRRHLQQQRWRNGVGSPDQQRHHQQCGNAEPGASPTPPALPTTPARSTAPVTITGGTLTGNGTVANLTIGSGGTLRPGTGDGGHLDHGHRQPGAGLGRDLSGADQSFDRLLRQRDRHGDAGRRHGERGLRQWQLRRQAIHHPDRAGGVSGTFGSIVNTNLPTNFQTG